MIPELGHFALILALSLALGQVVLPLVGLWRGSYASLTVARPAAYGQCTFLLFAFACLTISFINHDFSVVYVANNSNTALPLAYRIAAVWGAHEGSLLLWSLVLSIWMVAVARFSHNLPEAFIARVLSVMGLVNVGFLLFMLITSNPFLRHFPAAMEGRDLNPLLQDPGLVVHPPMLYMGYVGFSVAFAFAIAALMSGRLDAAWARWSRPWTVAAWLFLTVGITLGSWWAYYELGWGGWWFWDPVENASFMPWLVGTALIHSLAVTDKRDAFKSWTVLLAIAAFSLSLLGTFLVRSGVLTSVHAFATDPARGVFILALLGITIGGSLLLYAIRAPTVRDTGSFRLMSREGFLLANNVILLVATGSVLLGTLYPLFLDALKLGKISVGHPYFDTVFLPLMVLLGLLLGIGPIAHWKREEWRDLVKRLWPWAIVALVIAVSAPWVYGRQHLLSAAVGIFTAAWIVGTVLVGLRERLTHQRDLGGFVRALPRSFIGMSLAHLGFAMSIVGVTMVSLYGEERDVRLAVGETASVGGYGFRLEELRDVAGPNYQAMEARVTVLKGETVVAELQPQKRIYRVQTNAMTEAGIAAGFFRDLYVAMGEPLSENAWSIRLQYKPLIRWIWFGGVVMACGGFLALSDRRYRLAARKTREVFTETSLPIKASV